jgi:hypothetical protein
MSGTTIDLRRERRALYTATRAPAVVNVPEMPYLMIDGHGDPNTAPAYAAAVQALYAVAYTIRFGLKRRTDPVDAPVMPLEGLWWTPDMATFSTDDKSAWDWTLLIAVPDLVTAGLVEDARTAAARKHAGTPLGAVRLERFAEGRCAQVLHVGPYRDEGPTVAALHAFISGSGYALAGKHHEIYLGDPRRSAPEKLRTIVRQPVERRP